MYIEVQSWILLLLVFILGLVGARSGIVKTNYGVYFLFEALMDYLSCAEKTVTIMSILMWFA